jgi:uncharacterized FlgJ-related protein
MKKILYTICVIGNICLFGQVVGFKPQQNKIPSLKIDEAKLMEENNVELVFLYFEILENNIKYPDIVFAQAILESGYMSSQIFVENNNLFGMRYPERRPTVAVGVNKNYSTYNCWIDSVKDYKLFQEFLFRNKEKSRDDYFDFLYRIYAENKTYVHYVKKIINENQHIINKDLKLLKQLKESRNIDEYQKKLCDLIDVKKIV